MEPQFFVGIVLPPVIDYVNRDVHDGVERALVTVIVCFIVACLFDWNTLSHGTFTDSGQVLALAGILIAEASTVYKLYWQNSALRVLLPGNGVDAQEEKG